MRILLVDDKKVMRDAVREFLEHDFSEEIHEKVEVVEAEDGRIAIQIVQKQQHIDLVITDNHMPEMTGTELTVLVKAHSHIPVIMQSFSAEPKNHKADAFVDKGDVGALSKAIQKLYRTKEKAA